MLITAVLTRGGQAQRPGGQLGPADVRYKGSGHVYRVAAAEQRDIVGGELVVISGPHPDYTTDTVFTVELLSLPAETAAWEKPLPFLESMSSGVGGFTTICVE